MISMMMTMIVIMVIIIIPARLHTDRNATPTFEHAEQVPLGETCSGGAFAADAGEERVHAAVGRADLDREGALADGVEHVATGWAAGEMGGDAVVQVQTFEAGGGEDQGGVIWLLLLLLLLMLL